MPPLKGNGEEGKPIAQGSDVPLFGTVGGQPETVGQQLSLSQTLTLIKQMIDQGTVESQRIFRAEMQISHAEHKKESLEFIRQQLEEQRTPHVMDRLTGPVQFIKKLADVWALDVAELTAVLGLEKDEQRVAEGILIGAVPIRGRDLRDRIATLARIRTLLDTLFRNLEAEREWLRAGRKEFEGKAPLDLLREGSMEGLLTVRQFVEYVSGL